VYSIHDNTNDDTKALFSNMRPPDSKTQGIPRYNKKCYNSHPKENSIHDDNIKVVERKIKVWSGRKK